VLKPNTHRHTQHVHTHTTFTHAHTSHIHTLHTQSKTIPGDVKDKVRCGHCIPQ